MSGSQRAIIQLWDGCRHYSLRGFPPVFDQTHCLQMLDGHCCRWGSCCRSLGAPWCTALDFIFITGFSTLFRILSVCPLKSWPLVKALTEGVTTWEHKHYFDVGNMRQQWQCVYASNKWEAPSPFNIFVKSNLFGSQISQKIYWVFWSFD